MRCSQRSGEKQRSGSKVVRNMAARVVVAKGGGAVLNEADAERSGGYEEDDGDTGDGDIFPGGGDGGGDEGEEGIPRLLGEER